MEEADDRRPRPGGPLVRVVTPAPCEAVVVQAPQDRPRGFRVDLASEGAELVRQRSWHRLGVAEQRVARPQTLAHRDGPIGRVVQQQDGGPAGAGRAVDAAGHGGDGAHPPAARAGEAVGEAGAQRMPDDEDRVQVDAVALGEVGDEGVEQREVAQRPRRVPGSDQVNRPDASRRPAG